MDYIRFNIDEELKKAFIVACDGRTMTSVLEKLMKEYIEKQKKGDKNNENN